MRPSQYLPILCAYCPQNTHCAATRQKEPSLAAMRLRLGGLCTLQGGPRARQAAAMRRRALNQGEDSREAGGRGLGTGVPPLGSALGSRRIGPGPCGIVASPRRALGPFGLTGTPSLIVCAKQVGRGHGDRFRRGCGSSLVVSSCTSCGSVGSRWGEESCC
jgi:hypothetical protein